MSRWDFGAWEIFLKEVTSQLRPKSSQARAQGRLFTTKGIKCTEKSLCEVLAIAHPKCGMEFEEGGTGVVGTGAAQNPHGKLGTERVIWDRVCGTHSSAASVPLRLVSHRERWRSLMDRCITLQQEVKARQGK